MSTEQNIETARQMYEAFGRGDVQAILDLVTDDVDWSTDAAIPSAPWYGPRHGQDRDALTQVRRLAPELQAGHKSRPRAPAGVATRRVARRAERRGSR